MTYIVHGATGAQGSPVLTALLAEGHHAVAAVRDPASYDGKASAVRVDLSSPETLIKAYSGADGIFVHLPIGPPAQQLEHAHVILGAIQRARPNRVVLSTSGYRLDPSDKASGVSVLAQGIEDAAVSLAVIEPRLYFENLLLPPMIEGVRSEHVLRYPLRDDYAVSWSSHLDIADVASRLLTDTTITGLIGVGAFPGLTGADLAKGFTEHFGYEVTFESISPEALGDLIRPFTGPGTDTVIQSYQWRAQQPHDLVDPETSAAQRLNLQPRTVIRWLNDIDL